MCRNWANRNANSTEPIGSDHYMAATVKIFASGALKLADIRIDGGSVPSAVLGLDTCNGRRR